MTTSNCNSHHVVTRHRLLASTGQTSIGLAAGVDCFRSAQEVTASEAEVKDKVVLALIGAGGRGAAHASGMSQIEGVEFKYVCDIRNDRVGRQQLMFDGATERFTNSDAANALLKPAYRDNYRVAEEV